MLGRLGKLGVVAGAVLLAALAWQLLFAPVGCACEAPPDFGVRYDAADETLTVRHLGGDPFDAGEVHVVVDGRDRTWATRAGRPADGTVAVGDRLVVRNVSADAQVGVWARWGGERHVFVETTAVEAAD